MTPRLVRGLTIALAAVYAAMGTLEVVLKVAGDSSLSTIAFFGGTQLGGAALILCGLFVQVVSTGRVLIILGAAAGFLASAWTLVIPALAITVIVANALRPAAATAAAPLP